MMNPFRAVGRAVGKMPGMGAAGKFANKVPGVSPMMNKVGLGPSAPPQPGGGAMDQIRNKVAFGNMAQAGADQMGPMMQKPGPMQMEGAGPPPMPPQGPPPMQGPPPDQMQNQVDPRAIQMAQQRAATMGQGVGPSPQMAPRPAFMGRGRGQFGSYRQ